MMDGHCKDCRWWTRPVRDYYLQLPKTTRESVQIDWACCGVSARFIQGTKPNTLPLFAALGSGIIYTAPDFGCVQFEPKEAP